MKLCFIYPGSHPYDSVDHWVRALARFCPTTEIVLSRSLDDCLAHRPDVALSITEATAHPGKDIDRELAELVSREIPCGVLWNNDVNGPTPGGYPSFVWTQRSLDRLQAAYKPQLRRMPVFPPLPEIQLSPPGTVESENPLIGQLSPPGTAGDRPLLVGTFGSVEPKKQIGPMWDWAKNHGVPFRAFGPDSLVRDNDWYIQSLRLRDCPVTIHPWYPRIEDMAPLLRDVTHFLFVLTESKGGTGGSPTSPRYAGLFGKPVIVVDDELTYAMDNFYVERSLDTVHADMLSLLDPPVYHWGPERYVATLIEDTLKWWDGKRGYACLE